MIGPTGVGKNGNRGAWPDSRGAFIKVEALNSRKSANVGKDVDSIVRDLVETPSSRPRAGTSKVRHRAEDLAEERILEPCCRRRGRSVSADQQDGDNATGRNPQTAAAKASSTTRK